MEKKDCFGCSLYDTSNECCHLFKDTVYEQTLEDCPCTSCLVKELCENECNRFRDFEKLINYGKKIKISQILCWM
jgi:hypothetical protein